MVLPGAAEFCTVLFTVIFTNNGVHGEKLQLVLPLTGVLGSLMRFAHQTFRHQWFGDIDVLPRFHGDPSWKNICKGVWTS